MAVYWTSRRMENELNSWNCYFTAKRRERKGCVMFGYFWFRFSRLLAYRMYFSASFCTANERPVRIQYKCLVRSHLCTPKNETVQPPYFQNRIIMFWLPIPTLMNPQTHECRNWDSGRAIPFLGIHKLDFRYSV
jgi:hypothetical protein